MTLAFMRNKVVEVQPPQDNILSVFWRLTDNQTEAAIRLKVRLPDLEVAGVEARLDRSPHLECSAAPRLIQKVVGVRIGPGMRKIVQGLMGGSAGCAELAEGVLECANAVILHFTLPQIQANEKGSAEEQARKRQEMLRLNPRLARSCVAYADDSPLMRGFRP